jgi:hypothetical protein
MNEAAKLVARVRDEAVAQVYVVCTGAGAGLQQLIWSVPGVSSFLVGASFPYATSAIDEFIGFTPERYSSEATAIDMASAAYLRAGGGPTAIGIAVSAKVASVRAHRGDHHGYAASVSRSGTRLYSIQFDKDAGFSARERDGTRADHLGLVALLDAVGLPSDPLAPLVGDYTVAGADALGRERLLERPMFRASGVRSPAPGQLTLAFPGTFDPPHEGHFGMAAAAQAVTGRRPVWWITAEPPHKPPVPFAELLGRASRLRGHDTLFSRGDPLYIDKARRYPGCGFVIGTDALARMLDPKWGPSVPVLVEEFRRLETRFYVTTRVVDGTLVTLRDVPHAPADLCVELPGRWDVSSTELRRSVPP